MEDKEKQVDSLYEPTPATIRFTPEAEKECYVGLRSSLIKLLYVIEDEQAGKGNAELWFFGFMLELSSSNSLCHEKLTKVLVKMNGLYKDGHYKSMTHDQIKRQIMESRGIVDHLLEEMNSKK